VWGQGTRYSRCVVHKAAQIAQETYSMYMVKVQARCVVLKAEQKAQELIESRYKVDVYCSSHSGTNVTRD
jgi:hypothetical protein